MIESFAALSTEHKLLAIAAMCLLVLLGVLLGFVIPAVLSMGEERQDRTASPGVVPVPAVRRSPFARLAERNEEIVREREARRG